MKRLPKFATDDPDLQQLVWALNEFGKAIEERTPLKGSDCEIDYFPNGFRPKPKGKGEGSAGGLAIWSP